MEKSDPAAVVALIELVLGCAIHCADKEMYITTIMELEEAAKIELMTAIQRLLGSVSAAERRQDSVTGKCVQAADGMILCLTRGMYAISVSTCLFRRLQAMPPQRRSPIQNTHML